MWEGKNISSNRPENSTPLDDVSFQETSHKYINLVWLQHMYKVYNTSPGTDNIFLEPEPKKNSRYLQNQKLTLSVTRTEIRC
jgi:hypothetical protein